MTTDDLGARLIAATQACLQQATPLLRQAARTMPQVQIRLDLRGRVAGQLRRYADGRLVIRYNLSLAARQPDAFIAETVPHEVAHAVTHVCHGHVRPHGAEWRRVMHWLGVPQPRRCHTFDTDTAIRTQRRWRYQCACRTHQLSTTRHNRARRGTAYLCRCCGDALRCAEP